VLVGCSVRAMLVPVRLPKLSSELFSVLWSGEVTDTAGLGTEQAG
jgi:hypothetical protein